MNITIKNIRHEETIIMLYDYLLSANKSLAVTEIHILTLPYPLATCLQLFSLKLHKPSFYSSPRYFPSPSFLLLSLPAKFRSNANSSSLGNNSVCYFVPALISVPDIRQYSSLDYSHFHVLFWHSTLFYDFPSSS